MFLLCHISFAHFTFHTFCTLPILRFAYSTSCKFRTSHILRILHSTQFTFHSILALCILHIALLCFALFTLHTFALFAFFSHLYYCMVIAPFRPFSASHVFIPIFALAPSVMLSHPAITASLAPPFASLACLPHHRTCHSNRPLALALPR